MGKKRTILVTVLALAMGLFPVSVSHADTVEVKPYISLGADLSREQRSTVLSLLDVTEDELSEYEVIEITNEDEHEYLDEYLSDSVIGTKALSSVKIEKVEEGAGIRAETKNISYCTSGMYTNALITAGITDAEVTVAGPFEISGTAALVGAMKAYSTMTGEELSQENADAATNELVLTGELGEELGADKAEELVALVKQRILDEDIRSLEDIQKVIEESAEELGVTLTAEQLKKLSALLEKINGLDLDVDKLKQQAEDVYNKLRDLDIDVDKASGFFAKIIAFFTELAEKIANWFASLFG